MEVLKNSYKNKEISQIKNPDIRSKIPWNFHSHFF